MNLTAAGVHLIASFEGCVLHPYNDPAGFATIGYGHLIARRPVNDADRAKYRSFTDAQALELLHADCRTFESAVSRQVAVPLGVLPGRARARFAALVSLAYNIGQSAFSGSHVLGLVNQRGAPRDWHDPATAMLAWCHDGHGNIIPGLLGRRRVEARVLISGRLPA